MLVAVALGVLSLVAVVRAVDHITHSLQVGSVADRIATETIEVIRRVFRPHPGPIQVGVDSGALRPDGSLDVPPGSVALEAPSAGWVQQVDDDRVLAALPAHRTGYLAVTVGSFVTAKSPVMWVAPAPDDPEACRTVLFNAIAIGDSRTMQQDIEFGLIQLTDIAVRALSPGVNDPSTASDVIVHLGSVMTELWEHGAVSTTRRADSRTLVRRQPTHAALLDRAFSPIVHYGNSDRQVMTTLADVIGKLRSEVERRQLPGPVEPLDELLATLR